MKCDTCIYLKMCRLLNQYSEVISIIAQLTETKKPDYTNACNKVKELYDFCHYYRRL